MEDGRRPLIVPGASRHMLQEVNKSLSQVVRVQQQLQYPGDNIQIKGDLGAKPELSKSSPNLADKSAGSVKLQQTRLGYNQRAMAEIKQSLAGFQIDSPVSVTLAQNGYDVEVSPVNPHLLRQLTLMGCDEVVAIRALKLSGNKSVEAAINVIQRFARSDHRNGFARIDGPELPQTFGSGVSRKPSFENRYRTDSPVNSENSSVRSESPVAGFPPARHAPVRHGMEQPAPLRYIQNPNTQTVHSVPLMTNDRQTTTTSVPYGGYQNQALPTNDPPYPASNSHGYLEGVALSNSHGYPEGVALSNSHGYPEGVALSNSQSYPEGLAQIVQPGSVLQTPVSHIRTRMSPVQRDSTNVRLSHISQSPSVMATPVTLHRGQGHSPMTHRQPSIPGSNNHGSIQTSNFMHSQDQTRTNMQHNMVGRQVNLGSESVAQSLSYVAANRPSSAPLHSNPAQMLRLDAGMSVGMSAGVLPDDHSPLSSHSSSPGLVGQDLLLPPGHYPPRPVQAWNAVQPQIFKLQAKSREVQKPILQTATAPMSPPLVDQDTTGYGGNMRYDAHNYVSSVQARVNTPVDKGQSNPSHPSHHHNSTKNVQIELTSLPQSRNPQLANIERAQSAGPLGIGQTVQGPGRGTGPGTIQIHIKNQGTGNVKIHQTSKHPQPGYDRHHADTVASRSVPHSGAFTVPAGPHRPHGPRSESPVQRQYFNQSPVSMISSTSTPSTNSDMPEKPPPPYPGMFSGHATSPGFDTSRYIQPVTEEMMERYSTDSTSTDSVPLEGRDLEDPDKQRLETHHCTSPKPERSEEAEQRARIRADTSIKHFSSQACKFYMEQHFENIIKSHKERTKRQMQLEREMDNVGLSEEARAGMRKMLHQKESNYIRLKRAKIDKSMFNKLDTLGVGAFGEVALVCKKDTKQLFAMKTLRKNEVYQRNQVAHVKAERDILSEADNEWVVKLYYSFQDENHLYFVMDYIPGGDMMSLLIKCEIFTEEMATFYIAELVLAIQSVHKMGFIHRDIKPDNILIDRNGHIKLTDFGLCTGFRWTHSSKIYQNKGNHSHQDSMDPDDSWGDVYQHIDKEMMSKPLERRQLQQRSLAHSLVGTPNYIAPEVLLRLGYTACCDWWSVGVILYEMVVGQPPFYATTPLQTQLKVINYATTLHIPVEAKLSKPTVDLIRRLCTGPEERLGRNGADEIKGHPFFNSIDDIERLRQQPALYKPTISHPTDTSNFDSVDPDKLRTTGSGETHSKGGPENGKYPEHAFLEFTFRRFFDDGGHAFAQKVEDPESNSPVYV